MSESAHYQIDILVQGFPGKTVCHGALGWSTVALLRGEGRVILVDVGSFNIRNLLISKLKTFGLTPDDVTDVLLTHAHWDHMVNWTMFSKARIAIGGYELDWALKAPRGRTPVPEHYVEQLAIAPQLYRVSPDEEVLPGIQTRVAPGHTPGHLLYIVNAGTHEVILTGDAAKNRAELLQREAHLTMDAAQSQQSIEEIWTLWKAKPGTVLVPGHDMPMVLDDTQEHGLRYLAERDAAVECWFDTTLEQVRTFQLYSTETGK